MQNIWSVRLGGISYSSIRVMIMSARILSCSLHLHELAKALTRHSTLRSTGEFSFLDTIRFTQVKHNLDDLMSHDLIKKDLDLPESVWVKLGDVAYMQAVFMFILYDCAVIFCCLTTIFYTFMTQECHSSTLRACLLRAPLELWENESFNFSVHHGAYWLQWWVQRLWKNTALEHYLEASC